MAVKKLTKVSRLRELRAERTIKRHILDKIKTADALQIHFIVNQVPTFPPLNQNRI